MSPEQTERDKKFLAQIEEKIGEKPPSDFQKEWPYKLYLIATCLMHDLEWLTARNQELEKESKKLGTENRKVITRNHSLSAHNKYLRDENRGIARSTIRAAANDCQRLTQGLEYQIRAIQDALSLSGVTDSAPDESFDVVTEDKETT